MLNQHHTWKNEPSDSLIIGKYRKMFSPQAVCLWSVTHPPAPLSIHYTKYCWQTLGVHLNTLQRIRCVSRQNSDQSLTTMLQGKGLDLPRMEIACSRAWTACNLFLWFEKPWASRMCVNSRVCLSLGMLYITVSDSMISEGLSEI